MLGEFVMDYTMNGRLWEQMGNDHWWLAPHNVYRCHGEDRWVTIAVRDAREWRALCEAMQRPELAADPRFAEMASRHEHRRELDALIGQWTAARTPHWVMTRLQRAGVPAGVVMTEADAYEDRHLEQRGFFQTIDSAELGWPMRHVGRAWRASRTPSRPARPLPSLGQDNEYVYRELLGMSEEEYRRLAASGQIGTEYDTSIP